MKIIGGFLFCVLIGLCAAEWPMCEPLPSGGSGARWITPTFRYQSYINVPCVCSGACIVGTQTCRFECDRLVSDISGSCVTEDQCEYAVTIVGACDAIYYYCSQVVFVWMIFALLIYPIFQKLFSPKKKVE